PGQVRQGPADSGERGTATPPVHRRRRLDRIDRAEGRRPPGGHLPEPRALHLARHRGGLTVRAAIFGGPRDITVGNRPDPVIAAPTDAVVRVTLGCVCGSDLWYFRGESPHALGPIGHEFIGI